MRFPANAVTFVFNGEAREDIPIDVTHVIMHESITVIPAESFQMHPNIVEVYCHTGVKRIEREAFGFCFSLRRIVMPGVEVVERYAFMDCAKLRCVECNKLERVGQFAFLCCKKLTSIDLPSAKIIEQRVFLRCKRLRVATFGDELESFGTGVFVECFSLERIAIPLKHGLIDANDIFQECRNLSNVDIVKRDEFDNIIDALNLEEWKNDMNRAICSLNPSLRDAWAGEIDDDDDGEKAIIIREWITTVRRKFFQYKALHRSFLDEVASTLKILCMLPNDIVMNSVLPFLELPLHTFPQEEGGGEEDDSDE